jgi:acetolactate synthase-1/2/3 large subunit
VTSTGGKLISDLLVQSGIGSVFAVAGASHTHLLDPLECAGVRILSNRHEAGAVGAADGYARVCSKTGVALIVADQGLPNALGALAVAWHAQSPVLVLVACPPRNTVEADRAIDQDQLALVTPISKWARTVPSAERLSDYLQTALKHAHAGRRGPVVLLVPEDVFQARVLQSVAPACAAPSAIAPDAADIAAAADILAAAERPIIVSGAGTAWSNSGASLAELSAEYSLPVFANSLGRGQVPEDNELSFSWPYAQIAACHADVVLVVGARMTQRLGLGLPPRFSANAKFIQIDIDAAAFHRNRPVEVALQADATLTLEAIGSALRERDVKAFSREWLTSALANRRKRLQDIADTPAEKIHPLQLGNAIMERLGVDTQIVGDGADIQTWMYGAIRVRRPRGFIDHYPMGAMGSGTALAVGAAAAHKENDDDNAAAVVLVTGDGAIGFHPAEIHAAVRAGLKLVVIVGNDGAWGTELHGQIEAIGRGINTELDALPYEKLGEAFGATGIAVHTPRELGPGLDRAFAGTGVSVVNVMIDPDAGRELKTNPDVRMILFSDILDGQANLDSLNAEA